MLWQQIGVVAISVVFAGLVFMGLKNTLGLRARKLFASAKRSPFAALLAVFAFSMAVIGASEKTMVIKFIPGAGSGTETTMNHVAEGTNDMVKTALKTISTLGFAKEGSSFQVWTNEVWNKTFTDGQEVGWAELGTRDTNDVYVMKALWTNNYYTVTFDSNGGSAVPSASVEFGALVTKPSPDPTLNGYLFTEWTNSVGAVWNFASDTMPASNITLYAKWAPITYYVSFGRNGGLGGADMANEAFTYDLGQNLTPNTYTWDGKSFKEWNTVADGSGESYMDCLVVFNLTNENNAVVALFAQWTNNVYSITYHLDNGTNALVNPATYAFGDTINLEPAGKLGYTFGGWYNEEGLSTAFGGILPTSIGDTNVWAKFSANSYTVTYKANGGDGADVVQNFKYDEEPKALTANSFTRNGYTFLNWTNELGEVFADETVTNNLTAVAGDDVILYANWQPIEYKVRFNKNHPDATGSMDDQDFVFDVAQNLTENTFALPLGTFEGWALSPAAEYVYEDEESVSNLTNEQDAVVNLYAKWISNAYTVRFLGNGATGGSTAPIKQDVTTGTTLTFPDNGFTKTGYHFNKWAPVDWTTGTYDEGEVVAVPDGVRTIGAVLTNNATWTANSYTVTFYPNGGEGQMDAQNFTYDAAQDLTSNAYTKVGYQFVNWTNELGDVFADGLTVSNLTEASGGNIDLYAVWSPITYEIVFNKGAADGTQVMPNQELVYDVASSLTSNAYTYTGYHFVQWKLDDSTFYADGAEVLNLASTAGAQVTLTAQWFKNVYTVTFDSAGGSAVDAQYVPYDESITEPGDPEKTGYTFDVWKFGGAEWDFANDKMPASNITLRAAWTANPYTVKYDANKPENATADVTGETADTACTYDQNANLTANGYALEGWKFTGWNTKADGTGTAYGNGATVKNLSTGDDFILYAMWKPISYKVRFDPNIEEYEGELMPNEVIDYDTSTALIINTYEHPDSGFSFYSWNTAADGTGTFYDDGAFVKNLTNEENAVVTLYAVWHEAVCTVKFLPGALNVSNEMADIQWSIAESLKLPANKYTRAGYDFVGWLSNNGTKIKDKQKISAALVGATDGGTVTLTAQWTPGALAPVTSSKYEAGTWADAAALTYIGFLESAENKGISGLITVKLSKKNAKTGLCTASITVTRIDGQKDTGKANFDPVNKDISFPKPMKLGGELDLKITDVGISGTYNGDKINGAVDYSKNKTSTEFQIMEGKNLGKGNVHTLAMSANDVWSNSADVWQPYSAFSITSSGKSKYKLTAQMADGTKVSVSSQLIVGQYLCALPVMYTKKGKGSFGFVLWYDRGLKSGNEAINGKYLEMTQLTSWYTLNWISKLLVETSFVEVIVSPNWFMGSTAVAPTVDTLYYDDDANDPSVKLTFGVVSTDKKLAADKTDPNVVAYKASISYASKTGLFKGSFLDANNVGTANAKVKYTYNGVMINGIGYGGAFSKKGDVCSWDIYLYDDPAR